LVAALDSEHAQLTAHESTVMHDGREWADGLRDSLVREGRPVAGGWPGTVSEARTRVASVIAGVALSREQHGHLTRVLYEAAKGKWLSRRVREIPDE